MTAAALASFVRAAAAVATTAAAAIAAAAAATSVAPVTTAAAAATTAVAAAAAAVMFVDDQLDELQLSVCESCQLQLQQAVLLADSLFAAGLQCHHQAMLQHAAASMNVFSACAYISIYDSTVMQLDPTLHKCSATMPSQRHCPHLLHPLSGVGRVTPAAV